MNTTIDYLQRYEHQGQIYLTPIHQRTLSLVLGAIGLHPAFLIKERRRKNDLICVDSGSVLHRGRPVMACDGFVRLRSENPGFDVAVEIKTRASVNGSAHDVLDTYISQKTRLYRHFDAAKPLAPLWMLVVLMDSDLHQINQRWEGMSGSAADLDQHLRECRAVVGIGTSDGNSPNIWCTDGQLKEIESQLAGLATTAMVERAQGLHFGDIAQGQSQQLMHEPQRIMHAPYKAQIDDSHQLGLFQDFVQEDSEQGSTANIPASFYRFPRLIECLLPLSSTLRSHEARVVQLARSILDDESRDIFDALLRVAAGDMPLSYQGSSLSGIERDDVLFRSVFGVLRRKYRGSRGRTPWPIGSIFMHYPALLACVFVMYVRCGEYACYAQDGVTLKSVLSALRMPYAGRLSPSNPYYILLYYKLRAMLGIRNAIDAVEGL